MAKYQTMEKELMDDGKTRYNLISCVVETNEDNTAFITVPRSWDGKRIIAFRVDLKEE